MTSCMYPPNVTSLGSYERLENQDQVIEKFTAEADAWFRDYMCVSGKTAWLDSVRSQAYSFTLAMASKTVLLVSGENPGGARKTTPSKEELSIIKRDIALIKDTSTIGQFAEQLKEVFIRADKRAYGKGQLHDVSSTVLERVEAVMRRTNPRFFHNIVEVGVPSGGAMEKMDAIHFLRCNYPPFEKCSTHEEVGNLAKGLADAFYSKTREGFDSFSEDAQMTFISGYLRRCVEIHDATLSDPAKVYVPTSESVQSIAKKIEEAFYHVGFPTAHERILELVCPENVVNKYSDAAYLTLARPVSTMMRFNVTGEWTKTRNFHINARNVVTQTAGNVIGVNDPKLGIIELPVVPLVLLTPEEALAIRKQARQTFPGTLLPVAAGPSKLVDEQVAADLQKNSFSNLDWIEEQRNKVPTGKGSGSKAGASKPAEQAKAGSAPKPAEQAKAASSSKPKTPDVVKPVEQAKAASSSKPKTPGGEKPAEKAKAASSSKPKTPDVVKPTEQAKAASSSKSKLAAKPTETGQHKKRARSPEPTPSPAKKGKTARFATPATPTPPPSPKAGPSKLVDPVDSADTQALTDEVDGFFDT